MIQLVSQDFLKVCPVKPELQDDDWSFIVSEFALNYSLDSIRFAYQKNKEDEKKKVDADKLRELGFSEEMINKRIK